MKKFFKPILAFILAFILTVFVMSFARAETVGNVIETVVHAKLLKDGFITQVSAVDNVIFIQIERMEGDANLPKFLIHLMGISLALKDTLGITEGRVYATYGENISISATFEELNSLGHLILMGDIPTSVIKAKMLSLIHVKGGTK